VDCLPANWCVKIDPGFNWLTVFDEDMNRVAWLNDNGMIEGKLPPRYAVAIVLALSGEEGWAFAQNLEGPCDMMQLTKSVAFNDEPRMRTDPDGNSLVLRAVLDGTLDFGAMRRIKTILQDELRRSAYRDEPDDDYDSACTNVTTAVIYAEESLNRAARDYKKLVAAEEDYRKKAPEGIERDVGNRGVARAQVVLDILKALTGDKD